MKREAASALRSSGAEDWTADHEAFAFAYIGRLQEAREISRRAVDLAQQAAHPERAALFEAGSALWEGFAGNAAAARQRAMAALERSKDREVEYGAALALALSGDSSQSETVANDLERRFPEDTSVKFSYLPTLRAFLALNHGVETHACPIPSRRNPPSLVGRRGSIRGWP